MGASVVDSVSVELEAERARIAAKIAAFKKAGVKRLLASFANLQKLPG